MKTTFKDHFSGRAADYTRYRPGYPPALFAWLAGQTEHHDLAWDCGCGNGQAAIELVSLYKRVVATDPSASQIENAFPHDRISYSVAPAEASGLAAASIDLITVAQALHWFDFDRFYAEVRRVARPGGVLAAISYGEVRVEGAPDRVVSGFYHDLIGPYWPPERRYVDEHYTTIPFPFAEIEAPLFAMESSWNLEQLTGYLKTWSAVKEYERHNGHDQLALIAEELVKAWGDPYRPRIISWPLSLRVGRVEG
ncbi:class I SAM-dependent methyltransferase [Geobacter sp. OR-1]|uniref:class I SAM-dependent methyltransferase n=1 Tax=Geobacter sp. OR-1 TaxID=1266765 RepID=UPI0005A71727